MFDLSEIDSVDTANKGAPLQLRDVRGALIYRDKEPVAITLLGSDSDTFREVSRANVSRRIANKDRSGIDFEASEREQIELMVACTTGWSNVKDKEGKTIPFTAANAKSLYEAYPAVREQVESFVMDRANFVTPLSMS